MNKGFAISLIIGVLAVALIGSLLGSCSVRSGKTYRTMFENTQTDAPPETVIVTIPVTVFVTAAPAPGSTADSPAQTSSPGRETREEKTDAPEETSSVQDQQKISFETVETVRTVAEYGGKSSTMLLRYPAVSGLENKNVLDKINGLLLQIAEVKCGAKMNGAEEALKAGNVKTLEVVSSEVTFANGNIMSVKSEGLISSSDGSEPERFAYCNVINLSTGKDIAPKNIYTAEGFAKIMNLFKSGRFAVVNADPALASARTNESLMEQYKEYQTYNTMYPGTYFTEDRLCICIDVEPAYGYWADYSIPLEEVKDCLRISPLS